MSIFDHQTTTFLALTQSLLLGPFAFVIAQIHTALLETMLVLFPLISIDRGSKVFRIFDHPEESAIITQRNATQHSENTTRDSSAKKYSIDDQSSTSHPKTLPLYFLDVREAMNSNLPSTPFMAGFIALMSSLRQTASPDTSSTSSSDIPVCESFKQLRKIDG